MGELWRNCPSPPSSPYAFFLASAPFSNIVCVLKFTLGILIGLSESQSGSKSFWATALTIFWVWGGGIATPVDIVDKLCKNSESYGIVTFHKKYLNIFLEGFQVPDPQNPGYQPLTMTYYRKFWIFKKVLAEFLVS